MAYNYNTHRRLTTMAPVESISGKFARVEDTVSKKNPGFRWIGGMVKATSLTNMMVFRKKARTSSLSQAEIDAQTYFATGTQAGYRWLIDLTYHTQIVRDYNAGVAKNGVKPRNYRTVLGWVRAIAIKSATEHEGTPVNPWAA